MKVLSPPNYKTEFITKQQIPGLVTHTAEFRPVIEYLAKNPAKNGVRLIFPHVNRVTERARLRLLSTGVPSGYKIATKKVVKEKALYGWLEKGERATRTKRPTVGNGKLPDLKRVYAMKGEPVKSGQKQGKGKLPQGKWTTTATWNPWRNGQAKARA